MNHSLPRALILHEYIRTLLREQFPDVDDATLRDTLEGISDLSQLIAAIVRSQLDDVALAAALRSRVSDMQERLGRIEGRAEKKRGLVASVMERADLCKLTEPDFTVSLRPTPCPLVVTAEGEIPEAYWKPQPPKLDRKALLSRGSRWGRIARLTVPPYEFVEAFGGMIGEALQNVGEPRSRIDIVETRHNWIIKT